MKSYLLETTDYSAMMREIKKIIQKEKFEDAEESSYDMEEVSLSKAIEDLDTYGFLSPKKIIRIKNIEEIKQEEEKDNIEHLIKYIENPNENNLLIIEAKKLNNTTKLAKELKKKCTVVEENTNTKSYIKECLKGYEINQESIDLLDEYCLGDFTKITSETEKLKNYKWDEKKIEKKDIIELVQKKLGDSKDLTFAFSRSIALKDKKQALEKYRELLQYNIEPLGIIGLLGSQIRIIYQVKLLAKKHLNDREIANMLGEKEFRIKKTKELIALYTEKECLELMKKLSEIDFKIKTTDINSKKEIEMFILNIT